MRVWIPHLLLLVLLSRPATAAFFVDEGETGFEFLTVPTAARAVGLGNAFTAIPGEITAIDYNPGALIGIERLDINVSHQNHFEDASFQAVAFGHPVQFRNFPKMVAAAQYKEFHANDQARDDVGIPIGEITLRDQLIQLAAGLEWGSLGFGASWKYIRNKIEREERKNFAFDIGATYRTEGPVSLGIALLNFGPSKEFVDKKEPLPSSLRAGAAYKLYHWNLVADVVQTREKQTEPSLGAEFLVNRFVTLRCGGRYTDALEPSAGLGFTLPEIGGAPQYARNTSPDIDNRSIAFRLDYGFRYHEILGAVHAFTLKMLY